MKLFLLTLLITFSQFAGATDFGELVEKYVKLNQDKINIISKHRSRIKGVEIIVADKAENIASRFGHGLLRLVDDDNTWVNDAVISFSALSYEEKYSLRKSIFGGYAVTPQLQTFYEFWNMYTEKEERDLKRYVINLNEAELNRFLDVLFKYLHNPALIDDYTFLSNNCIGVITKMFVEAKLTKNKSFAKVPVQVASWIEKNNLSLYPEFVMKNNASIKSRMTTIDINVMSEEELTETFSFEELKYIVYNKADLSEEKTDFIAGLIKSRGQDLDSTYSFNPVHFSLYQDISDETEHLKKSDLKRTIVYRLNQGLDKETDHLKYSLVPVAKFSHSGAKLTQYKLVPKGTDTEVQMTFQDGDRRFSKRHLLQNQSAENLVVIKKSDSTEVALVDLK